MRIVESSDSHDDGWLDIEGLREVSVVQGVRTERHLLRPFDVLVTARSGFVQVALVPPNVSRTVAGIDHRTAPSCLASKMCPASMGCLSSHMADLDRVEVASRAAISSAFDLSASSLAL